MVTWRHFWKVPRGGSVRTKKDRSVRRRDAATPVATMADFKSALTILSNDIMKTTTGMVGSKTTLQRWNDNGNPSWMVTATTAFPPKKMKSQNFEKRHRISSTFVNEMYCLFYTCKEEKRHMQIMKSCSSLAQSLLADRTFDIEFQ
jgi:hypothetical protein